MATNKLMFNEMMHDEAALY